jgi:hypothetical protein
MLKKKVATQGSKVMDDFKAMAKTKQFQNFLLTPQGKDLAKTPEFKKLAGDFAMETLAGFL